MKSRYQSSLVYLILCLLCYEPLAFSQVDPTTQLLLRRGNPVREDRIDNSRFEQAPSPSQKQQELFQQRLDQPPAENLKGPEPAAKNSSEVQENNSTTEAELEANVQQEGTAPLSDEENDQFTKRVQEALSGGSKDHIQTYRKLVHPHDVRQNFIEFSVLPSFLYVDSKSDYWFRNYISSGPAGTILADVWLTPFFAIHVDFTSSLSHQVKAQYESSNNISMEHQNFSAGFRWRRFFGLTRRDPSITMGIDFYESFNKPSADATQRVQSQTTGVRLSLNGRMPTSRYYAWEFGVGIVPLANHEESATKLSLISGSDNETNIIDFNMGGRWLFDRKNQMFWKVIHRIERIQYEGAASVADPASGVTPEGVSVTQGYLGFGVGYTWGD